MANYSDFSLQAAGTKENLQIFLLTLCGLADSHSDNGVADYAFNTSIEYIELKAEQELYISGYGRWGANVEDWIDLANECELDNLFITDSESGSDFFIQADLNGIYNSDEYWCDTHVEIDPQFFLESISEWYFEEEIDTDDQIYKQLIKHKLMTHDEIMEEYNARK
ncbi:MAG: hypothetical protein U9N34_10275 [Candidatus Cloacimonadota bacterium]|nr:hypothetical protein [Candidatus Cloacimonadota bacterium]